MDWSMMNQPGEYFYSIAALFSGAAYILRNILWLRILLVAAAIMYIISGINLGITSMVGWNSAYLAINLIHFVYLMLDRITIALPEETRAVYARQFGSLSTREFKKLIMINPFCNFQDEIIVEEFGVPRRLYILLRGKVKIIKTEKTIATLHPGNFVGEMSFLTKEPASARAYAQDFVFCAYWTHEDLEKLKLKNLDVYNKFIAILGCDLVGKLKTKTDKHLEQITQLDFIL